MKKKFMFFLLVVSLFLITAIGYKNYYSELSNSKNKSIQLNSEFKDKLENDRLNNFGVLTSDIEAFPKGLVTFVDYDGFKDVWDKLLPLFQSKQVPCVVAMPTHYLNLPDHFSSENLIYLQDIGWEIASHGVNHLHLADLNEDEIDFELKESKDTLTNIGLNCNSIVYPFGSVNEKVTNISKKYYDSGITVSLGLNKVPLNRYLIYRVPLGSYFAPDNNSNELEYYKDQLDLAKKSNSWIIFMMHINETDDVQISYLSEVIDYCKKIDMPIVTLKEGFNEADKFLN